MGSSRGMLRRVAFEYPRGAGRQIPCGCGNSERGRSQAWGAVQPHGEETLFTEAGMRHRRTKNSDEVGLLWNTLYAPDCEYAAESELKMPTGRGVRKWV